MGFAILEFAGDRH